MRLSSVPASVDAKRVPHITVPTTLHRIMSRVAGAPPNTVAAPAPPSQPEETQYPVKWILNEKNASLPIVMQSANGPCALLALVNALLVTHTLTLPPGTTTLPESHLMALLAEHASSQPLPSENHAHLLQEFLDLLPTLSKGLHINVKFSGAAAFEFTKELSAFDILKVRLLHGWLVDPQDGPLTAAVSNLSYNQVVNELVRTASPDAEDPSAPPEEAFDGDAPVIEESHVTVNIRELRPFVLDFFEGNPTMLTVYGLGVLHQVMTEGETAILFRNSHFYVLRKKGGELYTLVTDVGYLRELNTVWEKLIDVTGDSVFYTGAFQRIGLNGQVIGGAPPASASPATSRPPTDARRPPTVVPGPSSAGTARTSVPGSRVGSRTSAPKRSSEKCVIQ